jgi:hypothetical protein
VIKEAETPRSYYVQQENKTFRRNRRDLIKTNERNTEPEDINHSVLEECYKDSVSDSGEIKPPSVTTSSGRIVKPPQRLLTEC